MTPTFDDFTPSGNLRVDPATYELENEAIERNGVLQAALRELADWRGRDVLDIGCGTGFWLPGYATAAASVVGVEPDPELISQADRRVAALSEVDVRSGSAEHLPLDDGSIDVAHARFAYFFGAGAEGGLAEVRRVLRPGGVFVAVDNDWGWGDFAGLLRLGNSGNAAIDPAGTDAWWRSVGASRTDVRAGWDASSSEELERILRLEFADDVVDTFLRNRERSARLTYGVALFVIRT